MTDNIYVNHEQGVSIYYTDAERDEIVTGLAEAHGVDVEEFGPQFDGQSESYDLSSVFSTRPDDESIYSELNQFSPPYNVTHRVAEIELRDTLRGLYDHDNDGELTAGARAAIGQWLITWQVMTVSETADEFGISREAVEKAIRAGRLPARQSGATWLFRREDAAGLWNHILQVSAVVMVITAGLVTCL